MKRAGEFAVGAQLITLLGAILLAACSQQGDKEKTESARESNGELQWARAALERNPGLKVESVDEAKHAINVRVKSSGEVVSVTPGELAAIPIGDLEALTNPVRVSASTEVSAPRPQVIEETVEPTPAPPAPPGHKAGEFKVERQDGRVRITGPGMNVESATNAQSTSGAPVKRFDEPIICEGERVLNLDRRHLNVDGDAIIARGGCELRLINSEVAATGTAIVVQDATVHVVNSIVRGGEASLDTGPAAKLYLQNSQFNGIARRDAQAKINDQGGNSWR